MYLLFFYFPIVSLILCGLFGRLFGSKGIFTIIIFTLFVTTLLSSLMCIEILNSIYNCEILLRNWMLLSNNLEVEWGFIFDNLSVTLLFVISLISLITQIYSTQYMYDDPHKGRFTFLLLLFSTCMFILVASNNFIQFILGWEGVGISSYLLINFWFSRVVANQSALQAIIFNRIGDCSLLLGILLIGYVFKTFNFEIVLNECTLIMQTNFIIFYSQKINIFFLIGFFFLIGAIAKSAQIGFHIWLPAAMEGPTPVSALLHSSTMVVAGIFLIIRTSNIFELCPILLSIICFIGTSTIVLTSLLSCFQYDIKKIIAFSTCSQSGYMFLSCGLSNYIGSFFHLITHAFFKSLSFFCAGCIIMKLYGEQDMRFTGALIRKMPITYIIMFTGFLAMNGLPFLSGYYSKEFIMISGFNTITKFNYSMWLLSFISISLTSLYSLRLIYYIFYTKPASRLVVSVSEPHFIMLSCLIFLFSCTIFIGYNFNDIFTGSGTIFWQQLTNMDSIMLFNYEFNALNLHFISLFISCLGFILFYYFEILTRKFNFLYIFGFEGLDFGFNNLYKYYTDCLLLFSSYNFFFKLIDRGFSELVGPSGLIRLYTIFKKRNFFFKDYLFKKQLIFFILFLLSLFLIFIIEKIKILILFYLFIAIIKFYKN